MNIQRNLQSSFFNISKNQYNSRLIFHPPTHTILETNEILKRIDTKNTPVPIADFGAGSGRITIPLLQRKYSVTAIDISMNSLENLKQVAKKSKLPLPHTQLNLPQKETFSYIVGADILHHVDLNMYLKMIYNALKPDGKIIFSEPGAYNISWYIYLSLFYDWQVEKGMTQCRIGNLKEKLEKAGFKQIKIEGLGLFPRPFFSLSKKLCFIHDKIGNLPILKYFAYRYIISAQK